MHYSAGDGIAHITLKRPGGTDVRNYLHGYQQDDFEWAEGYRQKFGPSSGEEGTLNRIPGRAPTCSRRSPGRARSPASSAKGA